MVSKKKIAKKDAKLAEEVKADEETAAEESVKLAVEEPKVETKAVSADESEPTVETAEEEPKEEVTELEEAPVVDPKTQLLLDAPKVPLILKIEDAVKFTDRYRVWKLRVKAETG